MVACPREPKVRRPHRKALREEIERVLNVEGMSDVMGDPGRMTLATFRANEGYQIGKDIPESKAHQERASAKWKDRRTWTGAVWKRRYIEMNRLRVERAAESARCRPVVSLSQPEYDRRYEQASGGKVRAMPKVLAEPEDWKTVRSENDEQA